MTEITPYRAARMCPACGGDSVVFRSMEKKDGTICRKRRCRICGYRFQTVEQLLTAELGEPAQI